MGAVELVIFHGDGCPYCAKMLAFLDDLEDRVDGLVVTRYEVWHDTPNRQVFIEMLAARGEKPHAVPTVVLGDQVYVGWSDSLERRIEDAVTDLLAGERPDVGASDTVDVPFLGSVDVGSHSMLSATVLISFVDGFNPCSLWVLSMLMALVVHSGSRRRVLAVGGLFLIVTSLLYGLYMFGAYSTLSVVGRSGWIRAAVALVAGVFGVLHLKEHWTTRGPSLTLSAETKPGLFRRMRRLADPNRSLPTTLAGTAVLATGVSLLETPCTAGLPLLWTDLLAERDVPVAGVMLLFALYLAVFLLDELVVFGVVVVTMRAAKMQERHGQLLQLTGGVLMVTLSVTMLTLPHLMESVIGTTAVFGFAVSACAITIAAERVWDRRGPPQVHRTS
jgi:cytochrome c biogenesis protein CcdA/glutaredoxin